MKNPSSERVIREGRGEGDDEDKRTWEGRERKSAGRDHLHQSRGKAKTVFCTVIIIED